MNLFAAIPDCTCWYTYWSRYKDAALVLGYTAEAWPLHENDRDGGTAWKSWEKLSHIEQEAAAVLGIEQVSKALHVQSILSRTHNTIAIQYIVRIITPVAADWNLAWFAFLIVGFCVTGRLGDRMAGKRPRS